ncbi:hypothetical protein ABW21_db0209183 [Orbilia brochopaga]|nr:hypothetical protein ABW21_db0209183 [Drechslerella brochopaga]
MLETLVFALGGTLIGTGWVTLASFISDHLYVHHQQAAYAFRAVFLVLSFIIHGYLRSAVPKLFVGVLLFLLTVIIQMTTPFFVFSHYVATGFLYPFLTGIVICTLVNVLVFPEFSSNKVAVVTVDALQLALGTLKETTDFFVSLGEESSLNGEETASEGTKIDSLGNGTGDSKSAKSITDKKSTAGSTAEPRKENPFKKITNAKEKLRKAAASSKATLKETSFEICYSCLPPARLHGISSKGLEALVVSLLTLIVACETKHIILGPAEDPTKKPKEPRDESDSEINSLVEKIENIRPKREAEAADEEFLRRLLETYVQFNVAFSRNSC